MVLIFTAACNRGESGAPLLPAPSAPTPLPPAITSYSGSWHGNFSVTECRGRRHCNESLGQTSPFVLLLQQTGARVDGVFQAEAFSVPVQGDVSAIGELSLTGHSASPGWHLPAVELTRFTARRSDAAGLVAELAYRIQYPAGTPPSVNMLEQTIAGSVASAARGEPSSINAFAGRWTGRLLISDCSTEGWLFCYPEERGEQWAYELTLTQSGDRVTGELYIRERVNITGSVSGNTLTLEPTTRERPVSSATDRWHLRSWTMTKDSVGQVRGAMTYERETVWVPSLQRPPYVSRYHAEIVFGVLTP